MSRDASKLLEIFASGADGELRSAARRRLCALVDEERHRLAAGAHPARVETRWCELEAALEVTADGAKRAAPDGNRAHRRPRRHRDVTRFVDAVAAHGDPFAAACGERSLDADRLARRLADASREELARLVERLGRVEIALVCRNVPRTVAGHVLRLAGEEAEELSSLLAYCPEPTRAAVERSADRIASLAASGHAGSSLVRALGHSTLVATTSAADPALASALRTRFSADPPIACNCDEVWLRVALRLLGNADGASA
jgi:hypothetical protein